MILEPDFLDHWKTRMLSDILGDSMAPLYVIRLWFHCQTRRSIRFEGMTASALKAICQYPGEGKVIIEALEECGFIEYEDKVLSVPKWAEVNSKMYSNWHKGEHGYQGGRPSSRQTETQSEPKANPNVTQNSVLGSVGEPQANPVGMVGEVGRSVGKEGKVRVGRGGEADLPTDLPCGISTQTVSEKAAEAYQRRRYKKPKPDADYYPALLREADEVFADNPNAEKMLAAFIAQCGVPFSKMPERATFSELCVAAGIKQLKPPSRGGGGTVEEKEKKLLLAAQKALQYSRSINQHESDFLAYGNVPREYKLKALELEKQNGSAA